MSFLKKFTAGVLTCVMLSSILLTGCGSKNGSNADGKADSGTSNDTKEPVVSTTGYTNTSVFSDIDFTDMDALEFSKLMGNGINLGNTLEAYGHNSGTDKPVRNYETLWGQPETTREMIFGMKNSGFDSIRIPVAWTNTMDYENGNYTIAPEYLDRVEEIVNWALEAEMFVIINEHWDGGWWAKFGSSEEADVEEAWKIYSQIWTQVSERFKDYPDMVIFESANEELGESLNNNSYCENSGDLTTKEMYDLTMKINQKFIEIVRNSGGNNDDRFLLVAGYNTDIDKTVDNKYFLPIDYVEGKLLLSVHYYTPWNYCGSEGQSSWGLKGDYEEMNKQFEKLTKFTEMGVGVIIGEYAALPIYDNSSGVHVLKDNTAEFTTNLLDNCDYYNYVPMLWSCNDYYSKYRKTMINKDILDLFTERCYAEEVKAGNSYLETVKARKDENSGNAKELWDETSKVEDGTPVAWIMWNGGAGTYSVGNKFDPTDNSRGITATNAIVEGAGEYTVSLDFSAGNNGVTFAALAIAYGETLYPNAIIDIKEILVDGNPISQTAVDYTSSDDGVCTRVNLYNEWSSGIPDDARNAEGDLTDASSIIIDKSMFVGIKNITIKFELIQ